MPEFGDFQAFGARRRGTVQKTHSPRATERSQTLALDNALHLTLSQVIVHYSLLVATSALGAGFAFFLVEKEKALPDYQGTMVTSAIICGGALPSLITI